MDMSDLEREAQQAPRQTEDSLKRLQALGSQVLDLNESIEKVEQTLSELKTKRWNIQTKDMIDLMSECQVDNVTVRGQQFKQSTKFHASIPEGYRDKAHDWLEAHEAGDLINVALTVSFPREFVEERRKLEDYIRKNFQMATVEAKRLVPWVRLTSWFKAEWQRRSQLDTERESAEDQVKDDPLPLEWLGASVTRLVEIVKPRKARGKKKED